MTTKGYTKPDEALYMTRREVAALLHAAHAAGDSKSYLLFAMQYILGLRVGEVVLLRYEHLGDRDPRVPGWPMSVLVPTLKKVNHRGLKDPRSGKPLIAVPVLSHPQLVLSAFNPSYRQNRRERKSDWLFCGRKPGDHMTVSWVIKRFHEYKHAAGLPSFFTPHSLRHSAATNLHERCKQMHVVSLFLRHSTGGQRGQNASHTPRYVHIQPEEWRTYRGCLDLPPLRSLTDDELRAQRGRAAPSP